MHWALWNTEIILEHEIGLESVLFATQFSKTDSIGWSIFAPRSFGNSFLWFVGERERYCRKYRYYVLLERERECVCLLVVKYRLLPLENPGLLGLTVKKEQLF